MAMAVVDRQGPPQTGGQQPTSQVEVRAVTENVVRPVHVADLVRYTIRPNGELARAPELIYELYVSRGKNLTKFVRLLTELGQSSNLQPGESMTLLSFKGRKLGVVTPRPDSGLPGPSANPTPTLAGRLFDSLTVPTPRRLAAELQNLGTKIAVVENQRDLNQLVRALDANRRLVRDGVASPLRIERIHTLEPLRVPQRYRDLVTTLSGREAAPERLRDRRPNSYTWGEFLQRNEPSDRRNAGVLGERSPNGNSSNVNSRNGDRSPSTIPARERRAVPDRGGEASPAISEPQASERIRAGEPREIPGVVRGNPELERLAMPTAHRERLSASRGETLQSFGLPVDVESNKFGSASSRLTDHDLNAAPVSLSEAVRLPVLIADDVEPSTVRESATTVSSAPPVTLSPLAELEFAWRIAADEPRDRFTFEGRLTSEGREPVRRRDVGAADSVPESEVGPDGRISIRRDDAPVRDDSVESGDRIRRRVDGVRTDDEREEILDDRTQRTMILEAPEVDRRLAELLAKLNDQGARGKVGNLVIESMMAHREALEAGEQPAPLETATSSLGGEDFVRAVRESFLSGSTLLFVTGESELRPDTALFLRTFDIPVLSVRAERGLSGAVAEEVAPAGPEGEARVAPRLLAGLELELSATEPVRGSALDSAPYPARSGRPGPSIIMTDDREVSSEEPRNAADRGLALAV